MNEMTHNFRFEIDYGHKKKLEGVIAALNCCRLMAHCHIKKVFKKFLLFTLLIVLYLKEKYTQITITRKRYKKSAKRKKIF